MLVWCSGGLSLSTGFNFGVGSQSTFALISQSQRLFLLGVIMNEIPRLGEDLVVIPAQIECALIDLFLQNDFNSLSKDQLVIAQDKLFLYPFQINPSAIFKPMILPPIAI